MAGPIYHALRTCVTHVFLLVGSLYTNAFVPGGTSGVLSKLKGPSNTAYADNFGFLRAVRRRFNKISAWCRRSHQSCIGNVVCVAHSPATKWFLGWVKYDSINLNFLVLSKNKNSLPLTFLFVNPFGPMTSRNIFNWMPILKFMSAPTKIYEPLGQEL